MTAKINYAAAHKRLKAYKKPLLGLSEMSAVLGLSYQTTAARARKGKFMFIPEPYVHLAMGPCWRKEDVKQWLDTMPPFFLEFGHGSMGC